MKIIFNDATELLVQSATIRGDGGLLIKTISDTEANLKNMFQDQTKTKKMTVTERESTLGEYENYTNMDAIVKYTAGIYRCDSLQSWRDTSRKNGGFSIREC